MPCLFLVYVLPMYSLYPSNILNNIELPYPPPFLKKKEEKGSKMENNCLKKGGMEIKQHYLSEIFS